jgi:hypothetical protein
MYAFMLVLCLAVSLPQGGKNKGDRIPDGDSPKKKSVASQQSPGTSNFVYQPTIERAQQQYDPYADRLYRAYLQATIIAAVFSFIVIAMLVWQNFLTRGVANAAKASADAIRNAERAWILVNFDYEQYVYDFTFTVYGRTPAKVTARDIRSKSFKSIDELPAEPQYDFTDSPHVRVYEPGAKRHFRRYFDPLEEHRADWKQIEAGELNFAVYGTVKYFDVIDDTSPHETRFCYLWDRKRGNFDVGGPTEYIKYT